MGTGQEVKRVSLSLAWVMLPFHLSGLPSWEILVQHTGQIGLGALGSFNKFYSTATNKQEFMKKGLSVSALLNIGFNLHKSLLVLSVIKALHFAQLLRICIIRLVYLLLYLQRIYKLTITNVFSCQVRFQKM